MKYLSLSFLLLIGFNVFIWNAIGNYVVGSDVLRLFFLDVGQGDSQLIKLPGGSKILIDGGPDKKASFALGEILPETDKYIDLVILTHLEEDHLGGLGDVLTRYRIGAFVWNGTNASSDAWVTLKEELAARKIPIIWIGAGDRIEQGEYVINVLSPSREVMGSQSDNEKSLVLELVGGGIKALYAGDIGATTEEGLLDINDLNVDILKVAHHGSRFSTGIKFLEETTPALALIEVGQNSYGHPHVTTLQRLELSGASVYRTDQNGTINLMVKDGMIGVKTAEQLKKDN